MKKLLSSKRFHFVLGLLVSITLIGWVVYDLDWAKVGGELSNANYFLLILPACIIVLHFILRAWRWKFLLPEDEEFTIRKSFDAIMIGNLATFILPLRAGEFIRPLVLTGQTGLRYVPCFVSIIVERFFDLASVLITFALLSSAFAGLPTWVFAGAWTLSVMGMLILVGIIIGALFPKVVLGIVRFFLRLLPKALEKLSHVIDKFVHDFLDGARVIGRKGNLPMIILLTAIIWFLAYLLFYSFLFFFDVPHSFLLSTVVTVVLSLAVAAPSAPGFIGVYQTACIAAFALFGVSKETAVAYSILSHIFQYVIFVSYGMFALSQQKLKLSELRSAKALG